MPIFLSEKNSKVRILQTKRNTKMKTLLLITKESEILRPIIFGKDKEPDPTGRIGFFTFT